MLFFAFPTGVRFLKVREGFIPFHAPRELSIAMKEMQEVGRIVVVKQRKECLLKVNFLKCSVGAAGHLGDVGFI